MLSFSSERLGRGGLGAEGGQRPRCEEEEEEEAHPEHDASRAAG